MSIHHPTRPSGQPEMDRTMTVDPTRGAYRGPGTPKAHAVGPYVGPITHPPHHGGAQPWPHTAPFAGAAGPVWPAQRPAGPPQTAPWPTPTRPTGRRWLIGAAALAVIAATALAAVAIGTGGRDDAPQATPTTPSTTATTPPAAPVSSSVLSRLLLSRVDAADAIGATSLGPESYASDTVYDRFATDTMADQECLALIPAEEFVHTGSRWLATRTQYLQSPTRDRRFAQTVVSYPDAEAAADFITSVKSQWDECSGRSVNFRVLDDPTSENVYWSVGTVAEDDGTITVTRTQEGGEGWVCQSAFGSRNNVVTEIRVCGDDVDPSAAQTVVERIGDRVDAQ